MLSFNENHMLHKTTLVNEEKLKVARHVVLAFPLAYFKCGPINWHNTVQWIFTIQAYNHAFTHVHHVNRCSYILPTENVKQKKN